MRRKGGVPVEMDFRTMARDPYGELLFAPARPEKKPPVRSFAEACLKMG